MNENKTGKELLISPSMLSSDFSKLKDEISQLENGGADWLHVDVMDGHFVPNLTFGPKIVKTFKKMSVLPLDVHLMIEQPERYIDDYFHAGADILTVHQEACTHLHRTVQQIHDLGARAGVSINPATNADVLQDIIEDLDLVLIMSVNPGFGGQKFIDSSLRKIEKIALLIKESGSDAYLEVDGGLDENNVFEVVKAGCNVIVSGTGVFKHENKGDGVAVIRRAAEGK